ncbi:MAG TPA: DNA recombination protein RmuC [Terracidiphilus sp.]|jgi:DNA recombination protein RmuC
MQALIAALAALAGIILGYFLRHSSVKNEKRSQELNAAQALDAERRSAEAREAGLREQIENARREVAELRPKAEELAASRQKLADEEAKYLQMKAELDSAFKSAAADALRANTQSFLALAKQELGGQAQDAKHTLETKEKAIQALLQPLETTLKNLDVQTRAMEKERAGAYGEIRTLVEGFNKEIPESLKSLRTETSQLITALRAPKTRGNWGELQLKRCVEYAGMVQYCSFSEQVSARDEDESLLRPDMKIQLPNGRCIIVDAKTPLDAFLGSSDSGDGYAQALRFAAHAETVKGHLRKLSAKTYWKQFDHTPEFVVCFLPSEALFSAALEADPSLIEFSAHANVVMATPTTLIALLKAIAYGWQQSTITQNAKAIQQTGNDLYNKLVKAHEYFEKLGNALKNAVGNYNSFIGAVEGRQGAFYQARKLGGLVHSSSEVDVAAQLEAEPRLLTSEDWTPQIQLPMSTETEEPVASE